jgi:flagellar biosynthetic protein FliQ
MDAGYLDLARQAIIVGLMLSLPILAVSLVIGLIISIFQAVTSIQEQTLTFVPKIIITGLALIFFGPWLLNVAYTFTRDVFANLTMYVK